MNKYWESLKNNATRYKRYCLKQSERRRYRYANDEEFREKQKERVRNNYWKNKSANVAIQ